MSLIGSIIKYRRLSSEQKAFIRDKGINSSMSAHKWVRFLEPIGQFDKQCDAARKRAGGIAITFIFITFISFFISSALQSPVPSLICVPILLISSLLFFLLKSRDVNDNIRNTLLPLLNILSLEVGNRQKISIDTHFHKGLKATDIVKLPQSNASTQFYRYEVLSLSCVLKDGSKLTWKVHDLIRRRRKTNPRGKVKIKFKLKRRLLISVAFRRDHYALMTKANTIKVGKFKQTESKIVYKHTLKQSAQGKTANIQFSSLLDSTRLPYQYLTQAQ